MTCPNEPGRTAVRVINQEGCYEDVIDGSADNLNVNIKN